MTEPIQTQVKISADTLVEILRRLEPNIVTRRAKAVSGSLRDEVEVEAVLKDIGHFSMNAYRKNVAPKSYIARGDYFAIISASCEPIVLLQNQMDAVAWQEIWQEKATAAGLEYGMHLGFMGGLQNIFRKDAHEIDKFEHTAAAMFKLVREHHDAAVKYNASVVAEAKVDILKRIA